MLSGKNEMWRCPGCGRRFASHGQTHTCSTLGTIDTHFIHSSEQVRATFDRFKEVVEALGPVEVLPQKTRIAFHARMSFAVLIPRQKWITGHLVLAERVDDPHFTRITTYSRGNHVHEFRLVHKDDIDATIQHWIGQAYEVGMQRHHGTDRDDLDRNET